jgi:S-adenosylmethionine/arginine decarboxylase-like enzyme
LYFPHERRFIAVLTEAPPEYRRLVHNGEKHYGQHMMVTALGCNEALLSIEKLYEFLQQLADDIDMVRYGPPIVARFGKGHETGCSGVQLIETSQISFHSNDNHRDMYLDVFSCKSFEEATVTRALEQYFSPSSITSEMVYRK